LEDGITEGGNEEREEKERKRREEEWRREIETRNSFFFFSSAFFISPFSSFYISLSSSSPSLSYLLLLHGYPSLSIFFSSSFSMPSLSPYSFFGGGFGVRGGEMKRGERV
jgi:hypothetical protein